MQDNNRFSKIIAFKKDWRLPNEGLDLGLFLAVVWITAH